MITYLLTYLFVMTGGALWTGHSNAPAEYAIKEKKRLVDSLLCVCGWMIDVCVCVCVVWFRVVWSSCAAVVRVWWKLVADVITPMTWLPRCSPWNQWSSSTEEGEQMMATSVILFHAVSNNVVTASAVINPIDTSVLKRDSSSTEDMCRTISCCVE